MSQAPNNRQPSRKIPAAKTVLPAATQRPTTPPQVVTVPQPTIQVQPQPFVVTQSISTSPRSHRKSNATSLIGLALIGLLFIASMAGAAYVLSQPGKGVAVASKKTKPTDRSQPVSPVETKVEKPEPVTPATTSPLPDAPTKTVQPQPPVVKPTPPGPVAPPPSETKLPVEVAISSLPATRPEPIPTETTPPEKPTIPPTPSPNVPPRNGFRPPTSEFPKPGAGVPAIVDDALLDSLIALHKDKKLLSKKSYPEIRKLFADQFEKVHGATLKRAYGEDAAAMEEWFMEHPEIREDFYTALQPAYDKVANAATIFNQLRKEFPDKIVPYANLAIATAIVWDHPQWSTIYDFEHHCRRCKAIMPQQLMDAVDNFRYYVKAESVMEGRIRYVPWEFLKHVINHKTAEPERIWAVNNYAAKRLMYGKCYSEVPYDHVMLNTHSEKAQMNNKEYTLPNLLTLGGVCAMQADYSSRVGKSIGVSSEYVTGEAAGGELHAWVMWVELKQATPTGLIFTLESHGRYQGDKYYVGALHDPQTGQNITDRDLELRLQTVGLDTVAKRQSQLLMQVFPAFCEKAELKPSEQLALLAQIVTFNPGCEEAWLATAKLARDSNGDKQLGKAFQGALDRLFTTFIRVPDFTWKVFGDLVAYYPEGKPRIQKYERLIQLYDAAERPDLACKARLVVADMQAKENFKLEAINGLAATVMKYPNEGRYLPALLDKIEFLCQDIKDADKHLVNFYTQVLPLVPKTRGTAASPFAIKMFGRAATVFRKYNQPVLAQAAEAEQAKLQAAKN